ncbi:MAG: Fe-S protein assembly co-chaperone HscB [Acidobacteria bacterium]|nr:Fe-S protein assembly co-chaperone HscB [Acidobacteriota bacterium]MBI3279964.1 Fe-S protein assembly co-chaperone HscB [Acidobacteriota bacterium]
MRAHDPASTTFTCWHCTAEVTGSLFCPGCKAIQAPVRDYYRFFGLERKLSLDTGDLQHRFYELSRQLHPDRFQRRSPQEQQCSLEASSVLNDGYRVLRNPIERAEYVLKQEGFDIGEQRGKDVPPELLEEVFELNMVLEEMRGGEESARPQLEQARTRFQDMRREIDDQLGELFRNYDESRDRAVLARIRGVLNRRRYIGNLLRDVEKELEPAASLPGRDG